MGVFWWVELSVSLALDRRGWELFGKPDEFGKGGRWTCGGLGCIAGICILHLLRHRWRRVEENRME